MTQSSLVSDLKDLFEVKTGKYVTVQQLKEWLPTIEVALWFAKVYAFDAVKVGELLSRLFHTDIVTALTEGEHSVDLQDYLVDIVPDDIKAQVRAQQVDKPLPGEVLPELWEMAQLEIAAAIQAVADKLVNTLHMMPSKQGAMAFSHMAKLNRQRPSIGTYQANIQHTPVPDALVILDVSGSMSEHTISTIINDVVAMSWKANASLAIVSDTTTLWAPGDYSVSDVLDRAEYGGTRYETLAPLFYRDWGTVVTIADYDSAYTAKSVIGNCTGHIGTVLDISLVNRSTFLAECVGQLADKVQPLMVARRNLTRNYW